VHLRVFGCVCYTRWCVKIKDFVGDAEHLACEGVLVQEPLRGLYVCARVLGVCV
jgi:hypothetical protein